MFERVRVPPRAQAMVVNFVLTCLVGVSAGLIQGTISGEIVLVWPNATQC